MKFLSFFFLSLSLQAHEITYEGALINFSNNQIKISGSSGTEFDTSQDQWNQSSKYSQRLQFEYMINKKSKIRLLYAPLSTKFNGEFNQNTVFNNQSFNQGTASVYYQFNSYRIAYHQEFYNKDGIIMNYGFVGKIRDAKIQVSQGINTSVNKNVGFVPLLHFDIKKDLNHNYNLLFDIDGLIAPQGRAFDAGFFINKQFKKMTVFTGYRFLDGGADNEKVKTFSFVNYYSFGLKFFID